MSSVSYEAGGFIDEQTEYIQLTKFNKKYEVIDYVWVASRLIYGDEGQFYINTTKSILEDDNGNIYLIWTNSDGELTISFINNDMELIWDCHLEQTDADITFLYDAFIIDGDKLAVYGDYVNNMGYFGVCYIVTNNAISVFENSNNICPYTFYPNPAVENISIRFSPDVNCEKVEIYSLDGKLCLEQNFNFSSVRVDGLTGGIYMMRVTLDNGDSYTDKIVVK